MNRLKAWGVWLRSTEQTTTQEDGLGDFRLASEGPYLDLASLSSIAPLD